MALRSELMNLNAQIATNRKSHIPVEGEEMGSTVWVCVGEARFALIPVISNNSE